MKILVSGSLAYDHIMDFPGYFKDNILPDKIHLLNVSFYLETFKKSFGGTAGNIAYNLALLKEEPIILSSAGWDFQKYRNWLEKFAINTSFIRMVNEEPTALVNIITDQAHNQIAGFYPGAIKKSSNASIKNLKNKNKDLLAIISPGNLEDMVRYGIEYRRYHIPYIFDPSQQIPVLSKKSLIDLISGAKIFISNDYELSLAMKKCGWGRKKILNKVEILITTLGNHGSVIETRQKRYKIPIAKPKNTSDPTGAGDAYRAGIIKGLVNNYPIEKMGRLAALVSIYTVEKYGTQTHYFTLKSLNHRYYQNFKDKIIL